MCLSKREKPCFYLETVADVTGLLAARPAFKRRLGVKVTTNAFYISALARAAAEYPLVLGMREDRNIRIAGSANVGFAVNAPRGLVVPVVKAAHEKSLAEIAFLEKELTEKARSNSLTLEEMEGETIALSNLGAYGVDSFMGIVPPPASVLLAVGNVAGKAMPRDGGLASRKTVSLSAAVDHQVVTPVYACRFLAQIKTILEGVGAESVVNSLCI